MVPTAMTASENMSENNKATGGSKMSMAAENSAVIPEMRDRAHTVSGHSPRPLKLAISAGILLVTLDKYILLPEGFLKLP